MSYIKSLRNALKFGNRVNEILRTGKNSLICFSSCSRGFAFSCMLNGGFQENQTKVQAILKTRYHILAVKRLNIGRNVCVDFNFDSSFLTHRVDLITHVRCMAGHSKWQNIRHIKAAKDREKGKLFQKYSIAIKKAVLDGGPDPRGNTKLAHILEEAKQCNMPNASIERSIKKAKESRYQSAIIEIQGPGGTFFVVEIETDNLSRSVHEVKQICRKLGAAILPGGRTRPVFDQKGIIVVTGTKDNSVLDCTQAMDVAIEAGAEDIQEVKNDNEKTIIKFLCDPDDFNKVKKYIESTNYIIDDASVQYIAKDSAKVPLNDELIDAAGNLCSSLEELSEVVNIYDNVV